MFAAQSIAFNAFSGFGDMDTSGQALRGSVVDVYISIGQAWRVLSYTSTLTRQLVDRLNTSGFQVLNADDHNVALLTGGSMRLRVKVLTDGYANASDAASVVAGAAAALGYNVTGSTGVLVSAAPSGSGAPVPTSGQVFDPSTAPNSNQGGGVSDSVSQFFDNLTKSPTTLAVILGAAVILVIAAKGR